MRYKIIFILLFIMIVGSFYGSADWVRPTGNGTGGGTDCSALGSCSNIAYLNMINDGNFSISGDTYVFSLTSFPMNVSDECYDFDFDQGDHYYNSYFVDDQSGSNIHPITPSIEPVTLSILDGSEDVGVVALKVEVAPSVFFLLTMYFPNSVFTNGTEAADWLSGLAGGASTNATYYRESIFTANGESSDYTWANPDGMIQCGNYAYTNPPELLAVAQAGLDVRGDNSEVAANMTANMFIAGDKIQIIDDGLFFGSATTCVLPGCEYVLMQAFKQTKNVAGNAAGLLFGLQDSSSVDNMYQWWAISSGASIYGDANYYSTIYPYQGAIRLDINNKQAYSISMNDIRFTFAGGSHTGENRSHVGSLDFFNAQTSREGAGIGSTVTTMTMFHDSSTFDWNVTNFYGLYLSAHGSNVLTNNYGVYSLNQNNYFANKTGIGVVYPQYMLHVGNTSATNNISIYAEGEVHAARFVTHTEFPIDSEKSKDDVLNIRSDNEGGYDFSTVSDDIKSTNEKLVYDVVWVYNNRTVEDCHTDIVVNPDTLQEEKVEKCFNRTIVEKNPKMVHKKVVVDEGVDLGMLTGKLVQTIQEQQDEIDDLRIRIETLEKK